MEVELKNLDRVMTQATQDMTAFALDMGQLVRYPTRFSLLTWGADTRTEGTGRGHRQHRGVGEGAATVARADRTARGAG